MPGILGLWIAPFVWISRKSANCDVTSMHHTQVNAQGVLLTGVTSLLGARPKRIPPAQGEAVPVPGKHAERLRPTHPKFIAILCKVSGLIRGSG